MLEQSSRTFCAKIEQAFADKRYRGKEHHPNNIKIFISGRKNLPVSIKKLLKQRSGIEPIIGHLKQDHRLDRNYLLGKIGDKINALLTGCGFNLRKILNGMKLNQPCLA
jgi:IS5 family transposase